MNVIRTGRQDKKAKREALAKRGADDCFAAMVSLC